MDTVFCKGDEPMLVNCTNTSPGHCPHLKDIGVVCPGMTKLCHNPKYSHMHKIVHYVHNGRAGRGKMYLCQHVLSFLALHKMCMVLQETARLGIFSFSQLALCMVLQETARLGMCV